MTQGDVRRRAKPATTLALPRGLSREVLEDRTCAEVVDAARAVHDALGAGHDAETYRNALAVEVAHRALRVHRRPTFSVLYRQVVVGSFEGDLLVDERVLLLVRSAADDERARAELLRGLATGAVRVGLLVSFGDELVLRRIL